MIKKTQQPVEDTRDIVEDARRPGEDKSDRGSRTGQLKGVNVSVQAIISR